MLWKRSIYAVAIISAVTSFIITDSGVALFLCVCLLVVPAISYVLLIFAGRRVRFDMQICESRIRGGALEITVKAGLSPRFLAGFIKVTAEIENTTFRKTDKKTFYFKDLSFVPHDYNYVSTDSGRINVKVSNLVLIDIFGLCSHKIKCPKYAESIVSPVLYEDLNIRLGSNSSSSYLGENSLPVKGNDHTELFNVRDYAPGDSLNSVHWKLSGKFDSLKTKEFGGTDDNRTLILVDMSRKKAGQPATDEQLNCVLDASASVSESLKSRGIAHCIGWFNDGAYSRAEVYDNDSFVKAIYALMSIKVDDGNAESLFYLTKTAECSIYNKIIFVTAYADSGELRQNLSADVTAVSVGQSVGEVDDGGLKIVYIPCSGMDRALCARVL